MVEKAIETLKDRYPDISVAEVVDELSIHQAIVNKIPTDVLVVSYTDTDPEKAKAILEALGSTYVDYSLERQQLQAANAIKFIDSQLPDAQKELDEAAKEIRQFRQVHQLVDPEMSAVEAGEIQQGIAEQIEQTEMAIALNKKQSQELNRQLKELGQDSETMLASSVLGQDGVYQSLASQLKDIETQYNLGKIDFHDDFHVMAISHNLGIVLAEFELRVLIVDADLRKPKLHKLARISNEAGLSDAITKEKPWTDYIQEGSVKNLHLITAGATSPNPIALLNSEKMKQLIQEWETAYDYVLIDTPPIGVIADAKSLANEVDSILFISGIQRVTRKAISNALDVLRNSQCHIAGVVANMVDPEFDYYAYSYYDSYYNQSHHDSSDFDNQDADSETKKKGILEQFRRR